VLLGGALADRYDRRSLMLVSDAARFVLIGTLAVVDGSGHLTIEILGGLAFAEGLATGFFTPALGGLIPLVVEQPGLGSANALIGMARQASLLIGPTVAGLIYGFAGSTVVFGFNSVSYLASFAFVLATRPRAAERAESVGTLREIWTGIRYVAGIPWLWVTITLFAFVLMFQWAPIQVLTPKLVRDHFDLSVRAYGVIFSMLGAGMIVGAVTFAQTNPRRRRGLISYLIWMLNSLLIIVFALSPWYSLALVASFCRGICIGFGVAVWETMLMELVPEKMLSRVVSLDWFGAFGLTPFGLLAAGAVSGYFAAGSIIAGGAVLSMCLVAAGLLSREIREID
jgi:MFS family permease